MRRRTRRGPGTTLLFPIALAVAALPVGGMSVVARGLLVLSATSGVLAARKGFTRLELRWLLVSESFSVASLLSLGGVVFGLGSQYALANARADVGRQFFLVTLGVFLALALRDPRQRRSLAFGLVTLAIGYAAEVIVAHILFGGTLFPAPAELERFKFFADEALGIELNPISFAMVLSALMSTPLWIDKRWLRLVLVPLLLYATYLAGSWTTIASVLLAAAATWVIVSLRKRSVHVRAAGFCLVAASLCLAIAVVSDTHVPWDPRQLSAITTGRFDLWIAALTKFSERPVLGWGSGSWRERLEEYLPGYTIYGKDLFVESVAGGGGFHNAYLTVLAEKGMVGFLSGAAITMASFVWAFRLHRNRHALSAFDQRFALIAPVLAVVLAVRALGEQPGLVGNANGTVDFLAYAAVAQVVAVVGTVQRRRSVELGGDADRGVANRRTGTPHSWRTARES